MSWLRKTEPSDYTRIVCLEKSIDLMSVELRDCLTTIGRRIAALDARITALEEK